jgi:hypothetical protein
MERADRAPCPRAMEPSRRARGENPQVTVQLDEAAPQWSRAVGPGVSLADRPAILLGDLPQWSRSVGTGSKLKLHEERAKASTMETSVRNDTLNWW